PPSQGPAAALRPVVPPAWPSRVSSAQAPEPRALASPAAVPPPPARPARRPATPPRRTKTRRARVDRAGSFVASSLVALPARFQLGLGRTPRHAESTGSPRHRPPLLQRLAVGHFKVLPRNLEHRPLPRPAHEAR